jgi:hypothetical protein
MGWLDRAHTLLSINPAQALRAADAHAAAFPGGALSAERELIAVDALLRLGRKDEARRRGADLLRRFPETIYHQRLRSLLGNME